MKEPMRIQLSRKKGWRMPANTIKVDRPTRFGNRYVIGGMPTLHIDGRIHEVPDTAMAVRLHREELEYWAKEKPDLVRELLAPLRGKNQEPGVLVQARRAMPCGHLSVDGK